MGYSTKQEVIYALANAMTSGVPNSAPSLMSIVSIGNSITSTVPEAELLQYIRWADEEIDSKVSSIYRVPLTRINQGTYPIALDATVGDQMVVLSDSTRFTEGDVVLIRDDVNYQELVIGTFTTTSELNFTTPLINSYSSADTNIERIRYPEPVPFISAKLAAAHLFDHHFAAQQEGNESNYGKQLRAHAYDSLNQILAGAVRIKIPDANSYRGRRFSNGALYDTLPTTAEAGKKWFDSNGGGQ